MPRVDARSLVFTAPHSAEVIESAVIPVQVGQVLVETVVSAISPGTEMLFYRGQAPIDVNVDATIPALSGALQYPLKYGYACVGRVVELGGQVSPAWLGRLVFAFHPHESRFVTTPGALIPVPDGIAAEQAALLPNMETAVSLLLDGEPLLGERVVVFGLGIVGLLTTTLLAQFPLTDLVAVDQIDGRRRQALIQGATSVLDPAELAEKPTPDADLVYELSGNPRALDQAIEVTGFDGRIVIGSWYGQKRADLNLGGRFHRSRIRLIASQVSTIAPVHRGRWDKARRFDVAWSMLRQIDVGKLISHRFPISRAPEAYRLIDQHPEQTIQVLLTYGTDKE
jgi:2-desacetyl-2-hydroxyethyl bacteriochlorophyllide A dehydrogenase